MENISELTVWNVIDFVFIVCPSWGLPKYIKTKVLTTCFYLMSNFFRNKKRSGTSLPALVSGWVLKKKYFSCYIITNEISLPDCLYFLGHWVICVL